MNSKFQPSEDKFDDVAGHAAREDDADVEGHGEDSPAALDADGDGHLARVTALPEDDDDVEGHDLKSGRPLLPGERGRRGRTHDR